VPRLFSCLDRVVGYALVQCLERDAQLQCPGSEGPRGPWTEAEGKLGAGVGRGRAQRLADRSDASGGGREPARDTRVIGHRRAAGQEVSIVQVLAPEEVHPEIRGDWALCDAETEALVETSVTSRVLRRYQDALSEHTEHLRGVCRRAGITYVRIQSDASLPDVVLKELNSVRLLR